MLAMTSHITWDLKILLLLVVSTQQWKILSQIAAWLPLILTSIESLSHNLEMAPNVPFLTS